MQSRVGAVRSKSNGSMLPNGTVKSLSPRRRESLRRKFRLSTEATNNVAQEWRRLLRRFNKAQDGKLLLHEFLTAVRCSDVPESRGITYWSDCELEELWLAACKDDEEGGELSSPVVDIEELVHFFSHNHTASSPCSDARDDSLLDEYVPPPAPAARKLSPPPPRVATAGAPLRTRSRSPGKRPITVSRTLSPLSSATATPAGSPGRGTRADAAERGALAAERKQLYTSAKGSARDAQYVQHLEQQLEQQQQHIRLLAQLQTETEGHIVDLRQQNAQMTEELAGAARGAAELELRARDMRQEQQRLLLALATEERLKEGAQAEAHLCRERLSHESERVAGLEERGDAAGRERSSLAAEKAALLAKVSRLKDDLHQASALKDEVQQVRLALQLECQARLRAEKDAAESGALASERKVLHADAAAEVASKQEEVQRMREEVARAEEQLETARLRVAAAEASELRLRALSDEQAARLEGLARAHKQLQAQLHASSERSASTAEALATAAAAEQELKLQLARVTDALQRGREAEARSAAREHALEQAHQLLLADVSSRTSVWEQQCRETEELVAKTRRELEPQLAAAHARIHVETQRCHELEAQLAEKEQQFAHESRMLSESNARVRAELELSHQAASEVKAEMQQLLSNLANQRESNIQVVKENRSLLLELRTQEERNLGLLQMIHSEEEASHRLQASLDAANQDLETAKQVRAASEQEIEHLSEQRQADKAQHASNQRLLQETQEEVERIALERTNESKTSQWLRSDHKRLADKLAEAKEEASVLATQLTSLAQDLAQAEEAKEVVTHEKKELEEQLYLVQQRYALELERSLQYSRAIAKPSLLVANSGLSAQTAATRGRDRDRGGGGTHGIGRRGLEESRAGTRLALSTLSTLSPALSTVSHDMSQAPRAAPPWQQHHHNPRASVDQSASTSPAGGVHGGGGALSISWLRDSMLRPEASALPPDTHTARMLRPDAQSGQGRTAGDIARRESRREHVRGAARPWVDPSLP